MSNPIEQIQSIINVEPNHDALVAHSTNPWHIRLWYIVSNPFLYVLTGKARW